MRPSAFDWHLEVKEDNEKSNCDNDQCDDCHE